jgi:hypothetical protein
MTLTLWDRIFYKEIVGEITDKNFAARMLGTDPITTYEIMGEDGKSHYGSIKGHKSEPTLGDRVRIILEKGKTQGLATKNEWVQYGKAKRLTETAICYQPIVSYEVLDDSLDEPAGDMQDDLKA